MIRPVLGLLAALALSLGTAGCGEPTGENSARDQSPPSPALWEVTAPDGAQGWLFGTVHALPDGTTWRTPAFDDAFAEAGLLVVEIADMADSAAAFEEFRKRAYTPGLPDLPLRLEPGERPLLAALMQRAEADADDFDDMESWAAAMVLSAGVRSGDPENGVDRALIASGKPVLGLESFAGQYEIFDALPEQAQVNLLLSVAREARAGTGERLADAWRSGDVEGLARHADAGLLAVPQLRRLLLTGRNADWAARIAPLIAQGRRPFVAVGAAHVAGPDGLPALLEAQGYQVRRIQ